VFVLFVKNKRRSPLRYFSKTAVRIWASQREVVAVGEIYNFQCDLGRKHQFPAANSIAHETQISVNIQIVNQKLYWSALFHTIQVHVSVINLFLRTSQPTITPQDFAQITSTHSTYYQFFCLISGFCVIIILLPTQHILSERKFQCWNIHCSDLSLIFPYATFSFFQR
jgi:hypothetical protein